MYCLWRQLASKGKTPDCCSPIFKLKSDLENELNEARWSSIYLFDLLAESKNHNSKTVVFSER